MDLEKIGSSGWTRTSNPPVNSLTQVFGLAGSRAGSSDGILLLPAVRQRIGQRLASRLEPRVSHPSVPLSPCTRLLRPGDAPHTSQYTRRIVARRQRCRELREHIS